VTKARLLADVTEARGEPFAGMIDHLKKPDMAREAEKLLEDCDWLPEPLRTPVEERSDDDTAAPDGAGPDQDSAIPDAVLVADEQAEATDTPAAVAPEDEAEGAGIAAGAAKDAGDGDEADPDEWPIAAE
jgi:ParB family chromosome partitioning protein